MPASQILPNFGRAMLKERVFTAFAGIALLLVLIWLGTTWVTFLAGIVAIIAGLEFYSLIYRDKNTPVISPGLALVFLLATGPAFREKILYLLILIILLIPFLLLNIIENIKKRILFHEGWTFFFAVIFTGFLLSYYTSLINMNQGRLWTILTLFTTFAADSGAYFTGRAWGKRALAPKISPRKTWEGAVGGLICATVSGLILSNILLGLTKGILWSIIPGLLIGIFSPLGDLAASTFKRRAGVKDSGIILPGHGGILDRIDSLLISGIMIYYYVNLLENLRQ